MLLSGIIGEKIAVTDVEFEKCQIHVSVFHDRVGRNPVLVVQFVDIPFCFILHRAVLPVFFTDGKHGKRIADFRSFPGKADVGHFTSSVAHRLLIRTDAACPDIFASLMAPISEAFVPFQILRFSDFQIQKKESVDSRRLQAICKAEAFFIIELPFVY